MRKKTVKKLNVLASGNNDEPPTIHFKWLGCVTPSIPRALCGGGRAWEKIAIRVQILYFYLSSDSVSIGQWMMR